MPPKRVESSVDALDSLVTIGRSNDSHDLDRRVVREIARMVGGRVLLHRRGGRWLTLRPQSEHTLSGWTVRRLARERSVRSFRVKSRPEFWRPEQRRPGGVLVFPVGTGTACVARQRRFGSRERDAVRTVLRFLAARLAAVRNAEREEAAHAHQPPPPADPQHIATVLASAPKIHDSLLGTSAPWRDVLRQIDRVAGTGASVLLVGETGTGKEGVARALHAASRRNVHEFVAVNCGAVAPGVLGSELFGHVRGAFTGAERPRDGLFVKAHRGTLFLDEVADMPGEMQVALLRVLEDREVRPIGGTQSVPADVRVVAACNRDLADEVAAGRFRADLYHRLDVVRIDLPPLRERRDDIPLLATHFVRKASRHGTIHPDTFPLLLAQPWRGNVRELENVVRAASALVDGGEITPEIVEAVLRQRRAIQLARSGSTLGERAGRLLQGLSTDWLSAAELAGRLGLSVRTVNRDLGALVREGIVLAAGNGRARRYATTT